MTKESEVTSLLSVTVLIVKHKMHASFEFVAKERKIIFKITKKMTGNRCADLVSEGHTPGHARTLMKESQSVRLGNPVKSK